MQKIYYDSDNQTFDEQIYQLHSNWTVYLRIQYNCHCDVVVGSHDKAKGGFVSAKRWTMALCVTLYCLL